MDAATAVRQIIEHTLIMTIASADADGKPWISPVGFAYDDSYNLYWVSSKQALHSVNIHQRPQIAVSIYGKQPGGSYDGVYIDAEAFELSDDQEIQAGIALFKKYRPQPGRFQVHSIDDVTGGAVWRMYKAVPKEISKRSDAILDGQAITTREIVHL